jgi:hypothetical protein
MPQRYRKLVDAIEAETGRRPHKDTALRWAIKGRKGCRLKFVQFGRTKMTTVTWVRDFFRDLTEIESPETSPSPTARRREIKDASKKLDKLLK